MYERFTDRARKVMALANMEAQHFNHEYIGTEHILLGLIKEGSGVAANVLKNLGVPLLVARREVEKLVRRGPQDVSIGRLPQTPSAKRVIEYAIEEARNLNHNYVGTEHLLLGLLREKEGIALQVLTGLGLRIESVRDEVLDLLGAGVPMDQTPPMLKFVADPTSTVPEVLRSHPLIQHYVAIVTALAAEQKKCRAGGDEAWVRGIGTHLGELHRQLEHLVTWLKVDPNFGTAPAV